MSSRTVTSWLVLLIFSVALVGFQRPAPRPRPPLRQPAAASATPAVPVVTVFKKDATSVRGQVTASDPDSVTVTPQSKPGAAQSAEPVVIPWAEIRSLSNGFTREKALVQWKQANHANLCQTCRGDRAVRCDTCKGTAHDPAARKDCPTCQGELLVDCKGPRCDGGQVPCPNKCLKLTEGKWVMRDDGKRWRSFPTRRGAVFTFSEGHVGNLIVTDKEGMISDAGRCPTCSGVTKIDCPTCRGHGKASCATCTARKEAAACPASCEAGLTKCKDCDGSGLKNAQQPTGEAT